MKDVVVTSFEENIDYTPLETGFKVLATDNANFETE